MVDLKGFRKTNKITRSEMAAFFGVSEPFISQIENGRAKLPERCVEMLQENNRGWVITESAPAQKESVGGDLLQVIVAKIDEQNARFAEQNAQIDRLLTIIQQLTEKK